MNIVPYIILFSIFYSYIFSLTPTKTFDDNRTIPFNASDYNEYVVNSAVFEINFNYSELDFSSGQEYVLLDASIYAKGTVVLIDNTNIYYGISLNNNDNIYSDDIEFGGYYAHKLDTSSTDVNFYYGIDMTNQTIEIELHDGSDEKFDNTISRSDDPNWSTWGELNDEQGIMTIGASQGWTVIAMSDKGNDFNWGGTNLVNDPNIHDYNAAYTDNIIESDYISADFYSFADNNTFVDTNQTFDSPEALINHLAPSAIPEPSTYGILSGGLVLGTVLALRRRGRNL